MSCSWMRRAVLALAPALALLVAGCGSGTIESQLKPARIIVFGDGFSDIGQTGKRYTVNDGGVNNWTQELAISFGMALTTAASGGTSYATGNARINTKPDAAGNSATPTVVEQIDTFLASHTVTADDLVIVSGGVADIITETAQLNGSAQTREQMMADAQQAGRDLGAQVRRLVQAGATHVAVVGPFDLSRTPWGQTTSQVDLLTEATTKFNTAMLVSIVDLGANVLYVDAALLFNLMSASPTAYSMTNSVDPVCSTAAVDSGPGIGIGTGKINSYLCDTTTLIDTNYGAYLFADPVYPAPAGHIRFGDYAYQRIHARW